MFLAKCSNTEVNFKVIFVHFTIVFRRCLEIDWSVKCDEDVMEADRDERVKPDYEEED